MEGVSFTYDGPQPKTALQGVSLSIEQGEFVAIVGRNGSGKSTLAKHFNAILTPTSGEVWVDGISTKDEASLFAIRQTVGMVFQNPDNQIVATVVEEDVAFGPENLGVPPAEIRRRIDQALAQVRMSEYALHPPHLLSGGQKQRVAIAGVLAMQPRVLVLDESTAMLDPVGRKEVMETVLRLNRAKGMTVVLITHHMDEAVQAQRVIVLDEGRVVLQGTNREVFAQGERLQALGLDVPQVTSLAKSLKQAGLDVPTDILTVEEMVSHLCRLLSKT
ncbi:MAG: energy-coupling factor transporter ATPase [Firmicutes bacterium]|nr:energy-coupling factor transporter ATPase [Bacillota bacterium]